MNELYWYGKAHEFDQLLGVKTGLNEEFYTQKDVIQTTRKLNRNVAQIKQYYEHFRPKPYKGINGIWSFRFVYCSLANKAEAIAFTISSRLSLAECSWSLQSLANVSRKVVRCYQLSCKMCFMISYSYVFLVFAGIMRANLNFSQCILERTSKKSS